MTPGSSKKVWWICSEGHEWRAVIYSRVKGHGCPYCSGRYVTKDESLAVKYVELSKQWHPSKNSDLTPSDVSPGSNKKVWWMCERGHEWEAVIYNRTKEGGTQCPFCYPRTSRLEIRVFTELKSIFSDAKWIANCNGYEIDVFVPKYMFGVEVDGYWHTTPEREEYDLKKIRELLLIGIKIFRLRDERLRKLSEDDIFYRERERHYKILVKLLRKIFEKIELQPKDEKNINKYFEKNTLQNIREYRKIISNLPSPPPEKSLEKLYPQLAKEWNYEKNSPLEPNMFTPGSGKNVWWTCSEGHEYEAQINNRSNGSGCPYCAGKLVGKDNNLKVLFPDLALEWHPTKNNLQPDQISPGSDYKAWWICKDGHEWEATVGSRTRGSGCPYCPSAKSGRRASKGYNLTKQYPELVKEWHPTLNLPLKPGDLTPYSSQSVFWQCSKYPEHIWEETPNNRTNGSGCPYCSGARVSDLNSVESKLPELVKEWHPTKNGDLTPNQVSFGSMQKVWWRCECGYEWQASPNSRSKGRGCPECAKTKRVKTIRKKLIEKQGSLTDHYPELVKEWHPTKNGELKPSDFPCGSNEKVWWMCSNGHEWKTAIYYRTIQGQGCQKCYFENQPEILTKAIIRKRGSLADIYPEIAKDWHPTKNGDLQPSMVTPRSGKKVWWQCEKGHEWEQTVHDRTRPSPCPMCYMERKNN